MPSLTIMESVKLEVSIDEIMKLTRIIMKETKQRKVRIALKQMIEELKKANKSLVNDILVPLYDINSQEDFDRKFSRIRSKFKKIMTEGRSVLAKISCGKVINKLNVLKASQQWKKGIPLINRSIVRMELLADSWIASDGALYSADQQMIGEINNFLDSIANDKPSIAYKKLKTELKGIEDHFLKLKDQLAELEILSDQLST